LISRFPINHLQSHYTLLSHSSLWSFLHWTQPDHPSSLQLLSRLRAFQPQPTHRPGVSHPPSRSAYVFVGISLISQPAVPRHQPHPRPFTQFSIMSDYSKMKNAELEALLKERGLPHSGKKADLVARLQEDDKKKASAAVPEEDEIDWDLDDTLPGDEPKTTAATTAAPVSETKKEEPKPQVAKVTKPAVISATTAAVTAKTTNGDAAATMADKPTDPATADVPAKDYTAGLKETNAEDEIEKRRKRIKRFMDPNDPESVKKGEEELKKLDRAEKFKDLEATTKVDSALPERKRKRDPDNESGEAREGRGGGFKRRGRRFGRGGRGGDGQGNRAGTGAESKGSGGAATWMSDADRAKAESRKQRFAQSTA
jgi:SAP domain-containing ribonucleoprotein